MKAAALLLTATLLAQNPQSPNPRERARAARDLGKRGGEGLAWLERLALDSDLEVRIEAVKGLTEAGGARGIDPLIRACGDPDAEMQIRATDGLVNFYLPGYARRGISGKLQRVGNSISAKFTDTNDDVVPAYVDVKPDVALALGRLVKLGATYEVRANAARAAGVVRGQPAVPDLIEALRSKDETLLYESVVALKKIRDPAAGKAVNALVRDLNDKIQIAAAETVGVLGYHPAARDLEELMTRDRTIKVKRATLTGLALLARPSSRQLFTQYLVDRDEDLRAAAAGGLGRLRTEGDLRILDRSFQEERKAGARLSMAFALVLHGRDDMADYSPLKSIIYGLSNAGLRNASLAFLVELAREPKVRKQLNQSLLQWNKQEKLGLAAVLSVSGDKDSVAPIELLVKDPDPDVSVEAARALRVLRARAR